MAKFTPEEVAPIVSMIKKQHQPYAKDLVAFLQKTENACDALAKFTFSNGNSLLSYAVITCDDAVASLLLTHKADVNKLSNHYTPLMQAANRYNLDMMKLLLKHEADANKPSKGYTPLCHAAKQGNLDMVELLLTYKANVNIPSNMHYTPLFQAALRAGNLKIVELLLEHGANVNAIIFEKTCLQHAIDLFAHNTTKLNLIIKALLKSPVAIINLTHKEDICVIQALEYDRLYVPAQCPEAFSPVAQQFIAAAVKTNRLEVHDAFRPDIGEIFNEQGLTPILCDFYVGKLHILESVPAAGEAAESD